MACSSAWCLIFMTVCLSLLLDPAFARGKGKKHESTAPASPSKAQPIILTPPPPPPPSPSLSPSAPTPPGKHRGKGHHPGRKRQSPKTGTATPSLAVIKPSLSDEMKDLVSKSLSITTAPAPSPSNSLATPPPPPVAPPPPVTPSVPVSGSLAMILAAEKGKSFTDNICDLAANPTTCTKILETKDDKYLASLPAGTTSVLSIELSAAIAAKAALFMSDKMTSANIDPSVTTCVDNYQEAIVGFTGAYGNFTIDPTSARQHLNDADVKLGSCEASLKSGPQAFLPEMDDTNKLLRALIQLVLKEVPAQ